MKKYLIAFFILIMVACAEAGQVLINGQSQISCTGQLILQGIKMDSQGNVNLTVQCRRLRAQNESSKESKEIKEVAKK